MMKKKKTRKLFEKKPDAGLLGRVARDSGDLSRYLHLFVLCGGRVLREEFGFDEEQTFAWFEATVAEIKKEIDIA
jgi:hypothetical protein